MSEAARMHAMTIRLLATAHQVAIIDGQGPAFIAAMREYLKLHDKLERAKQ